MSARDFPTLPASTVRLEALQGLYVPEVMTPLAFTPLYAELSPAELLSYNRKHGE